MHTPSLHIVFYTEGLPFHGHTMYEQALGGSETALICMARELAALGHRVRVFCRCPRPGVYSYRGSLPIVAQDEAHVIASEATRATQRSAASQSSKQSGDGYLAGRSSAAPLHSQTLVAQEAVGQESAGTGVPALQEARASSPASVEYLDLADFPLFCETDSCDVFVCSRFVGGLAAARSAKFHVLWCHDVLTRETAPLLNGLLWKIDRLFVLSQFQKEQYARHLPKVSESLFYVTRNGVDIELAERALSDIQHTDSRKPGSRHSLPNGSARDGGRFIYTSRPERGLEILLDLWPQILGHWPDAELLICRYDHPEGDRRMSAFLAALSRKMEGMKGLRFLGGLSKEQLYQEMAGCDLMLYPSIFPEISCVSAIEAAACGLPVVASRYCALKETVLDGETGLLIAGDPRSEAYRERYLAAVQKLIADDELRGQMSQRARELAAERYRWSDIAREWEKLFLAHFRSIPKKAVLRHLAHNSDLVAARDAGLAAPAELGIDWLDDPEKYRLHYEDAARRGAQDDPGFEATLRQNSRFDWLKSQLVARPEIESLLDVGCWFGYFSVGLSNEIPRLKVVGFDVSHNALARAEEIRKSDALRPENVSFCSNLSKATEATGSDTGYCGGAVRQPADTPTDGSRAAQASLSGKHSRLFDAAFLGEVLEHVPAVEPFIAEVEQKVREGGWIFVTLPRGPWESMSFESNRRKGIRPSHVRSWECRDVLEVFGQKDGFELAWSPGGETPLGEPVGHWLVAYRCGSTALTTGKAGEEAGPATEALAKAGQPCEASAKQGAFDHARKLICSPRQTLSVCMILGGEEAGATLHRCLRSVRPIADEIIIARSTSILRPPEVRRTTKDECDDETLRIARQYADTIFEIPWLEEDGLPNFAAARNRSTERATCDWILWLDADEYLVGASELPKYLRPNIYNAYVIRQWHHAIDAHFEPDLPMRCFRNGLGIKFYGAIHEHPETALNMGISPHVILTDVNIIHDGYVTEEKRVGRFRRNLPVLVKDRQLYPERRLGKLFWLRDLVQSARHDMTANGGPTREARSLLEEAVELYRAEFSSPSADFHNQARGLYEHALQLLGRGHPIAVLVASPNGLDSRPGTQPEIRRVETLEELNAELSHVAATAFHEVSPSGNEFAFD